MFARFVSSSRASRLIILYRLFLTAFLIVSFAREALAQVYVGGVQSQIGAPNLPWSGPVGVASDPNGNIYIAQYQYNSSVLKIDAKTHATSTLISTLTSVCGNTLSYAQGLASDSANNLYIADQGHNRVLVYNLGTSTCSASYIVTVPFAVALDSSSNIWVTTDGPGAKVSKIPVNSASGVTGTPVITGQLSSATGLVFDSTGNLYVSDQVANVVYKYTTPNGTPTRTSFLTSANGSSAPYGLMFDANGNLYVCEATSNQVLKYLAPGYTTYVQVSPNITHAEGVNQDPSGNVFFTAYQGNTVTEISPSTGDFGQVNVGSSHTLALNFDMGNGTTIGSFQVVDQGLTTQEFNEDSPDTNSSLCATGTYGSSTACAINVTFTPKYPGQRMGAVNVLDSGGSILATAYLSGTGMSPLVGFSPGSVRVLNVSGLVTPLDGPRRPVFDPAGNLYLIDLNNNRLVKVAPGGAATVVATPGQTLSGPNAVTLDGAGNLYINNSSNVIKLTAAGVASQLNNNGLSVGLIGIAVDSSGNVYAADSANSRIIEYPRGGAAQVVALSGVTLSGPAGVVVDGAGTLYVADSGNNRIVKIVKGVGSVVSLGTLTLSNPRALSIDSPGNLYISDSGNNRIVQVSAAGSAPIVLSTGSAITLNTPIGAAVAGNGDLYIMDAANNRIVVSSQASAPTLTYGSTVQGSTSSDSPKTLSVLNLGNLDLSITSAVFSTTTPTTGTSFSNDAGTTTCTATLAANSSCVYGIDFTPVMSGTNSGSLTLTDNTLGSVGSTQAIFLTGSAQALVSKLAFGQVPALNLISGGSAGSAITVLEEDANGATVTSQADTITLVATGPNGYQQTYTATAVAGVATFNLSGAPLNTSGIYTYTASSGSPTNAVATETVSAGSASTVTLSGGSTSVVAGGNAGVVSATLVDAHGNTDTSYSGAVSYTLKNAAGVTIVSGTATSGNGVASINLAGTSLTLANTDTLTVTAPNAGSTSESIVVSPGTASTTTSLTGIHSGTSYTPGSTVGPLTTTIVDAYGNTVATYSGTITYTLTLPDGTTSTGTATVVNGVVTVLSPGIVLGQVGSYSLTIAGTGIASTATSFSTSQLAVTATISSSASGVSYGTSLATAITSTATSNGAAIPGSWTYTATSLTTGATVAVTSSTVLPAGNYTIIGTFTPTDTTKYKSVTTTASLRVIALDSSAIITASVNPVALKSSTVLSASVSSSVGVPTGTVVFYDGTLATPVGSAALSNGVAILSTASLAAGAHSIVAQYQGDANHSAINSAAYNLTVVDFTLAVTGSGAQSVLPGGIATYGLTMTPAGASTFPAVINLSVTGLPDGAVATFTPTSIAAASGTTPIALAIGTTSTVAMLQRYGTGASMVVAALLLPFGSRLRRRIVRQPRLLMVGMLAILTMLGATGLSGCGSSVGLFGQKQQTYTVVVSGTSGSLTHSTNVTLTVQ